MPNQEIITGLRNAIQYGESLQEAIQVMINSGYNPGEVQEASKYVGGGVLITQEPKPEEQLIMPEKKQGFFSRIFKRKPKQTPIQQTKFKQESQEIKQAILPSKKIPSKIKPLQPPTPSQLTTLQPIKQTPIQQKNTLTKELKKIKPKKRGRLKEIILLITLLVLVGILVITIIFKDKILGWFG